MAEWELLDVAIAAALLGAGMISAAEMALIIYRWWTKDTGTYNDGISKK